MHADTLIDTYMERLEAEAARLPSDRRADLVTEVRAHIATAISAAGRRDEATVRTVLDRLGEPSEIIAAEMETGDELPGGGTAPAGPMDRHAGWGAIEIVAVLLMTVGALLLPIVGPLIGLVFAWQSARWTRRAKTILSVVVLTIFVVVPVLGLVAYMSGGDASQEGPVRVFVEGSMAPSPAP